MLIYPKESVCPVFEVVVDNVKIVTQYAANAAATNGAAGYGKVEFTVYDSAGAIVTDAGGQLLDHIPARCKDATGSSFYLTIYNGILNATDAELEFTVQGWYAVANGASDGLGWRGFSIAPFTIQPLSALNTGSAQANPPAIP